MREDVVGTHGIHGKTCPGILPTLAQNSIHLRQDLGGIIRRRRAQDLVLLEIARSESAAPIPDLFVSEV